MPEYKYLTDLLLYGMKFDLNNLFPTTIPKEIGIYAFFEKETDTIVYVGKATGKGGLFARIHAHLRPSYLLTDQTQWDFVQDEYQINNPAMVGDKPAIDQSSFRKNVARKNQLRPGLPCVEFIKKNFYLRFVPHPNEEYIKLLERVLRHRLDLKYNRV